MIDSVSETTDPDIKVVARVKLQGDPGYLWTCCEWCQADPKRFIVPVAAVRVSFQLSSLGQAPVWPAGRAFLTSVLSHTWAVSPKPLLLLNPYNHPRPRSKNRLSPLLVCSNALTPRRPRRIGTLPSPPSPRRHFTTPSCSCRWSANPFNGHGTGVD